MFAKLLSLCSDVVSKYAPDAIKADDPDDDQEIQKGQDHIFTFYEELDESRRRELDADYDSIDIEAAEEAFEAAVEMHEISLKGLNIEGPTVMNWELKRPPAMERGANVTKLSDVGESKRRNWRNAGLDLYNKQRVAVIIMSGGLDSKMTVAGLPKGVLDIGLLSHKSLFQIYTERIRRIQHLTRRKFKRVVYVPLYIMCNTMNREAIEDFYHDNSFFGLREQDVVFFTQDYMPVFDEKGKILLSDKHKIQKRPNGNGGLFKALVEEGMISDMKSRGVTSIYICSVDNLLTKVGDPVLIGYCESCKSEVGLKCVERLLPEEDLGVLCSQRRLVATDVDGDGRADTVTAKVRPRVIESFELPDDAKRRRQPASAKDMPPLVLHSGNLSQYYFKVDFIMKVYSQCIKRWHIIPTSVEFVDLLSGDKLRPYGGILNGRRLEMFVFDCFEYAHKVCGLEVARTEMALVNSLFGPNSPQSALQAMGKLHQQWILDAGGVFAEARVATDRDDCKVEVSPLVSYEGEDLYGHFPGPIQLPFYMPSYQELLNFSAGTSADTRRPSTHYLDWESDLGQHELEAELQGQLSFVMKMIEDPESRNYSGERATEDDDMLPPTPRVEAAAKGQHRVRGGGPAQQEGNPALDLKLGDPRIAAQAQLQADAKGEKDGDQLDIEMDGKASAKAKAKGKRSPVTDIVEDKRKEFWGDPDDHRGG